MTVAEPLFLSNAISLALIWCLDTALYSDLKARPTLIVILVILLYSNSNLLFLRLLHSTKMASKTPRLDVRLQADRILYLSRKTRFSLVLFITLDSEKPVTFIRNGEGLDVGLVNRLITHSVRCVDAESGEEILVLTAPTWKKSEGEGPSLMTLYDKRSDYLTFTTATTPREYEFLFETKQLQPDRSYTIRCHPLNLQWWSHDSQEDILSYRASHGELPSSDTPPLPCSAKCNEIYFSTRKDLPQPPAMAVSLSVPSTLSLSNKPHFRFSITFTAHAPQQVTVLAERDSLKTSNQDIEILFSETRTPVDSDLIDDWQHEWAMAA